MFRKLGVEPGEERLFAWGVAALFLLGWAEVSVKNVAETLFFKRVGVEHLPLVFLVNSVLLVFTTFGVARIAQRTDRLKLLPIVFLALAAALVPLWILVLQDVTSAFVLLVIASKQLQSIGLMIFFLALADLLHGRQAKRLFAPLTAGLTLGAIVGSFASEPISRATGIAGLIPLSAGALVLSAAAAWPLRRFRIARFERQSLELARNASRLDLGEAELSLRDRFRELWNGSRLFRLLFVTSLCSGLVGPMLYFQFSYVADLATSGDGGEERLMAFYSQFRGWISIGVLATQLGLTANLYRRIGIPLSAAISPLIYLFGFLGLSLRLSLPAGVGAMAGTKLQDNAIYDPAIRILFNLLPEDIRSRAMALLEGPVKRAGGALGNVIIMFVVSVGGAAWVGVAALPATVLWLIVALVLWRAYPALLMQAASSRDRFGRDFDAAEMLDANTLRGLSTHLLDPDPARCRVAIDLVSDAAPELAAEILAEASALAPDSTRSALIGALVRVMERAATEKFTSATAAKHIESLIDGRPDLSDGDRADLIRAFGRVTRGAAKRADAGDRVFASALEDSSAAVRLAAAAELNRRGTPPPSVADLAGALHAAVLGDDPVLRRTAREEYRTQLLTGEPSPEWVRLLIEFAEVPTPEEDRADVAETLADVASAHGAAAVPVNRYVLDWQDDPDPRVRAAVLRFIGATGLGDHAGWVVRNVSADGGDEMARVRTAARDAVRALGLKAADAMLVELSFGKRSAREAILPLVRELDLEHGTLQRLYENELNASRHNLVDLFVSARAGFSPLILQRLGERLDEGLHTAMQLLGAVHDDDRIYALADPLRRARGTRRYAILLEALDALLTPGEKSTLLPLLEDRSAADRGRSAVRALGIETPSAEEMAAMLRESTDDLTRVIAVALLHDGMPLAGRSDVDEHGGVLSPVECALLLRGVPLFEGLTARQLMNVADLMVEEDYPPDTVVSRRGEASNCMYIIAAGTVVVRIGDQVLNRLGPNQFFGEIAVFEGAGRTADVVTDDERVVLLRIDRDDLLSLMEELPGIAICICQNLSGLVRSLTERVNP